MITKNEISSLNLSPTKKDFVQIWNELIEVASKITERWDPTSTNESDPGIVLLKVLTGIADKLNYNIDKNILEAFMPTAAQMESMRKLCELVGYDIKYYQSAETSVRISYIGNTSDEEDEEYLPTTGLAIPKFTTITNADKDITFVTTNAVPLLLTNSTPWVNVPCIEGQISQCESLNEHNLITLAQLDSNNRYYLPEVQIAENGIFVYNAATSGDSYRDGAQWEQVSNLNIRSTETRVFKFGYDSFEGRPYLAFPDDIGSLIGDGLFIYFTRTSGLNGNISPRTLEVLEVPTGKDWEKYSAELFEVVNIDATTNGANIESISAAYNNFKKTVGTFDTLVTCRDYMNKIYSLMDASNLPYVSNILVTDIRNDINNAITLCSCNEFGILYKETPLTKVSFETSVLRTVKDTKVERLDAEGNPQTVKRLYIEQHPDNEVEVPLIDHFDLLLYPFKTFTQVTYGTKDLVAPYNKSFTYTEQMNREIDASLADIKTCAHNFKEPAEGDIVSINNYLRLNAFIATSNRVSAIEAEDIIKNVKVALVNEFNLRNLDFGEEIPFDSILSVIENADARIKVVSLQEPTVLTTYSVKETIDGIGVTSTEYGIVSTEDTPITGVNYTDESGLDAKTKKGETAKDIYNKLVLRNILAGRASLFKYDETFIPNNSEKPYTITKKLKIEEIDTNVQEELKALNESAEFLNTEKTTLNPGEQVLTAKGPNGGVLTLRVTEKPHKSDSGETSTVKEKEIFETYKANTTISNDTISNISRVEATCEITCQDEKGIFENIKLGKNEVIKFRAPNLITTKTFPAYVYYHFEHKDTESDSGDNALTDSKYGSFAKAMTLSAFINKKGLPEFFEGLWSDAGVTFDNESYTFEAKPDDPKNPKLPNGDIASLFKSSLVVEANNKLQIKKRDPKTGEEIPSEYEEYHTRILTSASDFSQILDEHFSNKDNTTPIKFRYYPLNLNTSSVWSKYIKKLTNLEKLDTDVLWQLSSTSSHPRGKFVTESGKKLIGLSGDALASGNVGELVYVCMHPGSDPNFRAIEETSEIELGTNDKLYIHYTPSSTNEDGETQYAEAVSVVYEGGKDEPVIIKPSGFTLMPSIDVNRQGTSWKKTNVPFPGHGEQNLLALAPNQQIELRSVSKVVLNTQARFYKNFEHKDLEQGAINGPVEYELKDGEYIFYTDQSTQEAAYYGSGSVITLTGGAYIPKVSETVEVSQILEQGLHIIPWSSIVALNDNRTVTITEYQYRTLVEGDTLNTLTVDVSNNHNKKVWDESKSDKPSIGSDWIKCSVKDPVTYTTAGAESSTKLPTIALGPDQSISWEVCSRLELSTSPATAQPLRAAAAGVAIDNGSVPTASIIDKIKVYIDNGTSEEPGPEIKPQENDTPGGKKLFEPVSVKLNVVAQTASGTFEKPKNGTSNDTNNTIIQMKVFKEEAPTKIELNELDDIITPISDKHAVPVDASTAIINNYWTKLDISSELYRGITQTNESDETVLVNKPNALKLNFMVPDNRDVFGIFSIYLATPDDKFDEDSKLNIPVAGARTFIDIPDEFIGAGESYEDVISIFNYNKTLYDESSKTSKTYFWWAEAQSKHSLEGITDVDATTEEGTVPVTPERHKLYLRTGLNCIKVNKSCSLLIKAEENAAGSLLYDNMRLVEGKETNGINLELLNPNTTFNAEVAQVKNNQLARNDFEKTTKVNYANAILDQIKDIDKKHDFYYNVPVENSLAIEFDNNISSFASPYTLYDINNINNSFVISKLDVNYLDEGLRIAKSSRY